MNEKNAVADVTEIGKPSGNNAAKVSSRRKFLGQVGAALAGGAVLGKAAVASAQDYNRAVGDTNALLGGGFDPRVTQSFAIRVGAATTRSADSRSATHDQRRRSALSRQVRHLLQGYSAGWDRSGEPASFPDFPERD